MTEQRRIFFLRSPSYAHKKNSTDFSSPLESAKLINSLPRTVALASLMRKTRLPFPSLSPTINKQSTLSTLPQTSSCPSISVFLPTTIRWQ